MKDHTRHQSTCSGIAISHRPNPPIHYHYVTRPKWSHGAQNEKYPSDHTARKHSWPFQVFTHSNEQPALASVSTDRQPLVRADSDDPTSPIELELEDTLSFTEKYGRCLEILHYGSNSTTRLHECKPTTHHAITGPPSKRNPQFVAIKVYRYNILDKNNPLSHAPSCSKHSISILHPNHPNILQITDLLYNERSELCLVTPFCAGGDLHALLSQNGPLPTAEADCIIAQILRAISFLHSSNTAHRDVRLETILLTASGAVKLAGFGNGHIRRLWNECALPEEQNEDSQPGTTSHHSQQSTWTFPLPWLLSPFKPHTHAQNQEITSSNSSASFPGISLPYIPPEGLRYRAHRSPSESNDVYDGDDPRPADIWSTAIIYLALINGRLPWRSTRPKSEDARYLEYLYARRGEDGYPPIEALGRVS